MGERQPARPGVRGNRRGEHPYPDRPGHRPGDLDAPDAAFVESVGPDDGVLWVQMHTGLATLDAETEVVTGVERVVEWNHVEPFVIDETGGVWVFGGDRGNWSSPGSIAPPAPSIPP